MSDFYFYDMEHGWPKLLRHVMQTGHDVRPRDIPTLERENVSFTLVDPTKAVVTDPRRALNHAFSAVEFMWVVSGQDEVETLAYFNSRMRDFADQPGYVVVPEGGSMIVRENARLFGAYGPPIVAQLPYIVRNLKADPDSRQAVVTIWRQSPPKTKDVPCTVMLQYLLRSPHLGAPRRLNALTVMRSNDLWLGTPYDVPLFCRVQQYVAAQLGVEVGTYTHLAGSMHIYASNLEAVEKIVAAPAEQSDRPEELVVGKMAPDTDPRAVWRAVEDSRYAEQAKVYGEGWNGLVRLAEEYAARRRAREAVALRG